MTFYLHLIERKLTSRHLTQLEDKSKAEGEQVFYQQARTGGRERPNAGKKSGTSIHFKMYAAR